MGFYIRKAFRVGPVRLNLSKSGLGVSAGVTGFRLGMNGRGTYVHMGRGGLYYRKQLSWNSRANAQGDRTPPAAPRANAIPFVQVDGGLAQPVENLAKPLEVSSAGADDAAVLAHFREHHEWSWLILLLALSALATAFTSARGALLLAAAALGLFALRALQARRAVLIYDLNDEALEQYQAFVEAFAAFFQSQGLWLYEERTRTSDWKRNAGASLLMKRRAAGALAEGDPKIRTNLSIPCLSSGAERIHFLPDLIVLRQGATLAAVGYEAFSLATASELFIEDGRPPSDAEIVGYAWQYARRDGGPDRRFNNNRQLPRCHYQTVQVAARSFQRSFSKSRRCDPATFLTALRRLGELAKTPSKADDLASTSPAIVT